MEYGCMKGSIAHIPLSHLQMKECTEALATVYMQAAHTLYQYRVQCVYLNSTNALCG